MEAQKELENEIGTLEQENKTLQPKKVKIVKVEIVPVGEKKNLKVNCEVEHPDTEQTISMSTVNILVDKKVRSLGIWYNLDKEEKIQKGSALAVFMRYTGSNTLKELEGKEVETELEGRYLSFKSY